MGKLLDFILSQGDQFRRARLPSLYSDFTPQRSSNPDGFSANIAAWQDVLGKAAQAGVLPAYAGAASDTLSFRTGEILLQALETKEWGRPLALGTVIDESIRHHLTMPYQEFVTASKSIHIRNWTVQPWWIISWGLKQLDILGAGRSAGSLPTGQFVIMANVEQAASKVIAQMATVTDLIGRILPMRTFREKASNAMGLDGLMSESDLAILLRTLARDKGAIVYNEHVVKVKALGEDTTTLSMEDKTIASLKLLIEDLNMQVGKLIQRIGESTTAAKDAVSRQDRSLALAALKSKNLNEATLVQRTDMLSQLEGVFHRIEQAHDQVAVMQVMQGSTLLLQKLRAQTGGVEKVEEIVECLRDEMQQVEEVGSAMEANCQSSAVDEDTIDDELEQMVLQVKAKEGEEKARRTKQKLDEIEASTAEEHQPAGTSHNLADAGVDAFKRLSLDENSTGPGRSSNLRPQVEVAPGG